MTDGTCWHSRGVATLVSISKFTWPWLPPARLAVVVDRFDEDLVLTNRPTNDRMKAEFEGIKPQPPTSANWLKRNWVPNWSFILLILLLVVVLHACYAAMLCKKKTVVLAIPCLPLHPRLFDARNKSQRSQRAVESYNTPIARATRTITASSTTTTYNQNHNNRLMVTKVWLIVANHVRLWAITAISITINGRC